MSKLRSSLRSGEVAEIRHRRFQFERRTWRQLAGENSLSLIRAEGGAGLRFPPLRWRCLPINTEATAASCGSTRICILCSGQEDTENSEATYRSSEPLKAAQAEMEQVACVDDKSASGRRLDGFMHSGFTAGCKCGPAPREVKLRGNAFFVENVTRQGTLAIPDRKGLWQKTSTRWCRTATWPQLQERNPSLVRGFCRAFMAKFRIADAYAAESPLFFSLASGPR